MRQAAYPLYWLGWVLTLISAPDRAIVLGGEMPLLIPGLSLPAGGFFLLALCPPAADVGTGRMGFRRPGFPELGFLPRFPRRFSSTPLSASGCTNPRFPI
jgi:hypothetical protein